MTQAVAHILEEVEQLSVVERADLADRLLASLAYDTPPEIERKQIDEVRRRIAQIEAGEVTLIPGHVALEQVRHLVQSAQIAS
ncbi:MAG: addiction module protein [Verrucomicrobiota bacterium]